MILDIIKNILANNNYSYFIEIGNQETDGQTIFSLETYFYGLYGIIPNLEAYEKSQMMHDLKTRLEEKVSNIFFIYNPNPEQGLKELLEVIDNNTVFYIHSNKESEATILELLKNFKYKTTVINNINNFITVNNSF